MARTIHLFVVVSGLAMMAEGFVALFYKSAWMVQQNAITVRGLLAALACGFAVALLDVVFVRLRTSTRTPKTKQSQPVRAATVILEKRELERQTEPPLAA